MRSVIQARKPPSPAIAAGALLQCSGDFAALNGIDLLFTSSIKTTVTILLAVVSVDRVEKSPAI